MCGAVFASWGEVGAHFTSHPAPPEAQPKPTCRHPPLFVNVAPDRASVWTERGSEADPALIAHPGWTHRKAPEVLRTIVEKENGASFSVVGWYYPHSRESAAQLDALYHRIEAWHAASAPAPTSAQGTARSRGLSWWQRRRAGIPMLMGEDRRTSRKAAAGVTFGGFLLLAFGTGLMLTCTSWAQYTGCVARANGPLGFVIVFAGVFTTLFGVGSFLASLGRDVPAHISGTRYASPGVDAKIERTAALVWALILTGILLVVEAVPIYNVVLLTTAGEHPTFNPLSFAVDMVLLAIADFIVLALITVYTLNE